MEEFRMKTLVLAAAMVAATSGFAVADPSIVVTAPWLRATPKGAPVAGGYATITNEGTVPDRLLSASLALAPKGEIHAMSMANGIMHMERLDKGLSIAPGASVTLSPGGDHLMFLTPEAPLKQGQMVKGTLTFATAGSISVTFQVAGMAAKTAPGDTKAAPGDMKSMPGMDMQ